MIQINAVAAQAVGEVKQANTPKEDPNEKAMLVLVGEGFDKCLAKVIIENNHTLPSLRKMSMSDLKTFAALLNRKQRRNFKRLMNLDFCGTFFGTGRVWCENWFLGPFGGGKWEDYECTLHIDYPDLFVRVKCTVMVVESHSKIITPDRDGPFDCKPAVLKDRLGTSEVAFTKMVRNGNTLTGEFKTEGITSGLTYRSTKRRNGHIFKVVMQPNTADYARNFFKQTWV